jgi:hypothetical protein
VIVARHGEWAAGGVQECDDGLGLGADAFGGAVDDDGLTGLAVEGEEVDIAARTEASAEGDGESRGGGEGGRVG